MRRTLRTSLLVLLLSGLPAVADDFTIVSAASYERVGVIPTFVASHSILALFSSNISTRTELFTIRNSDESWPFQTPVDGVKLEYKGFGDPDSTYRPCEIIYVSPGQMNLYYPGPGGVTTFRLTKVGGRTSTIDANMANISITMFSANATGQGPIIGQIIDSRGRYFGETYGVDSNGRIVSRPVPLKIDGEAPYLVFYVTGTGRPPRPLSVSTPRTPSVAVATIADVHQQVLFADTAGFRGQEQVNIRLNPATPLGENLPVLLSAGAGFNQTTVRPTISIGPEIRTGGASSSQRRLRTKKNKKKAKRRR